tara:strand:- start:77 stop:922 length:846 start_codon:yes stop_codon:yes gene_type:complete
MIIWLASYPKSGNTWIRSVLISYYFTEDGKFNFNDLSRIPDYPNKIFLDKNIDVNKLKDGDIHKFWHESQKKILEQKKAKFLKTHNMLGSFQGIKFTKPEYSLGTIHIIRDPRNVITSIKNHLNFESYDKAFEYIKSNNAFIKGEDSARFAFVGSWRSHYTSWMSDKTLRRITVKYEDLEKNTHDTFKKIIDFVNKICRYKEKIDDIKLSNSINSTSFDKMRTGEKEGKFTENVINKDNKKIKFFFMGPKNNWKKVLPEDIKIKMNEYYKNDLKNLNYENI